MTHVHSNLRRHCLILCPSSVLASNLDCSVDEVVEHFDGGFALCRLPASVKPGGHCSKHAGHSSHICGTFKVESSAQLLQGTSQQPLNPLQSDEGLIPSAKVAVALLRWSACMCNPVFGLKC